MTTDPTARHHAQILDWLSAALTDPDTMMISLHQDADEAGTWEIHTDRKVDPAKEATAASQADEDLLATYDDDSVVCQCWECQEHALREKALKDVTEAIGDHMDRVLKEHTDAPPAFRPEESLKAAQDYLKMKGGGSVKSYLEERYGQPDPAAWNRDSYDDGGVLPGEEGTTDDGKPSRPEWVDEALEDPDVVDLENSCQCDACQRVGRLINSYADDDDRVLPGFSGTEYLPSHGGFDLQRKGKDLRVAFYGFDSEAGVIYRVDTPEGVRRALEDLFRADDDDEGDDR